MSAPDDPDAPGDRQDRFRPRMGRRPRTAADRATGFRAQILRALQRQGGFRARAKAAKPRLGRIAVRAPHAQSRRCVVKARYVSLNARGMKAAKLHLAYLERDGVERDGSPGRLYGAHAAFIADDFRAPLPEEQRQFRFIVSPEDGGRLDLTEFARQLIAQVEKDTGRRLIWAAVNHHNTDNPHVHLVIRGVDRDGHDLRIDGKYIGQGIRWRAQEILTRELGRRSELDLIRSRSVDVGRERLTEIDRVIHAYAGADGRVSVATLLALPGQEGATCIGRLQALGGLELARQDETGSWRLAQGWKESLAALGERQDIIERLVPFVRERAIAHRVVDPQRPCAAFEGVVAGKGLDDELMGTMFAAVVTPAGQPFYVRVTPEVADGLREGERVRVEFEVEPWLKPADRIIARFAHENGGLYDPARHQRALETLHRPRADRPEPTPAERVVANVRRLERLKRYRLAARLPDGKWQVAADLVAQLEARERTHPQRRLRVEPVVVRERRELGQALAQKLGVSFVSDPPAFRGRIVACPPAPSGREYVGVVNHAGRQLTLIAKSPELERLAGRTITVTRDHAGRLAVRLDPGISR